MRILCCIMLLFFPMVIKADANGVDQLAYKFYVIPTSMPEQLTIEMFLKNEEDFPLHFEFPTSQFYEIKIFDTAGREVYDYSKGRFFLQAFQTISLKAHGSKKWLETWDYHFMGKRVPAGEYTIQAVLRAASLNGKPITDRSKLTITHKTYVPEENAVFRNIKVSGTKGNYRVSGEVKSPSRVVYYSVEDGHREFLREQKLDVAGKGDQWRPFKVDIQIPAEKLPNHGGVFLNFYEKNAEGGRSNPYPALLERFE